LHACALKPRGAFLAEKTPLAPDYGKTENWAALPDKKDAADRTPSSASPDNQSLAKADVFYLYPTTFTGKAGKNEWNIGVDNVKINTKTDSTAILYQASIFNAAGRVFAPRYRQAHLKSFFTKKHLADAQKAVELAYSDVKAAFEYYLKNYNQGRPIIIASHSQGARHAIHLLEEFFDGKPLQNQLVVAYLVGFPVKKNRYKNVPPCESAEQTGCFCSWRTFKTGYLPKYQVKEEQISAVNPLTWKTDETYAPKTLNEGGVITGFSILPNVSDAQVHKGFLWINRPKFRGSFLYWSKNYHPGDLNLYYFNVRNNAVSRVESFLKKG
jgi:hypothetical protein